VTKLPIMDEVEQQTLRVVGLFHSHPRVRIRAQAIVRLSRGLTLQQTADEFYVHLNSNEQWRQRWNKLDLADRTRVVTPAAGENGRTSNKRHCVRWPMPRVDAPLPCCVGWLRFKACLPLAMRWKGVTCLI